MFRSVAVPLASSFISSARDWNSAGVHNARHPSNWLVTYACVSSSRNRAGRISRPLGSREWKNSPRNMNAHSPLLALAQRPVPS